MTIPDAAPSPTPPTESAKRRWPGVLALACCVLVVGGAALRVAVNDPTDQPLSGDQAAFTLQALSIAGGNLSYDTEDQQAWLELGWEPQPRGLFVQKRDEGWAFAKPYGYSLLLAPFVEVAGATGISLVGAGLLLAYAGCWYAIGRTRWGPVGSAVVATAATVTSNAWLMAFPAHADLFVAVLVGVTALGSVRVLFGTPASRLDPSEPVPLSAVWTVAWACIATVAAAILVTEKLPALVAVGPLLAVALWRSPRRAQVVAVVLGVVVVAVSVVPYLYYSDGTSWNAYGGDRYYAPSTTPWSGGTEADLVPWHTAESMSPRRVLDSVTDPSADLPSATLTYAIGRHTGAFTFQPVVATLFAAALVALVRRQRRRRVRNQDDPGEADRTRPDRTMTAALVAASAGLAAYAVLYLVTFTDNYFGGGQSIGNRYFLQVSVVAAVIAVTAGVSERAARWSGAIALALGVVLLHPLLTRPEQAFFHLERTSAAQDLLPFDGSQASSWRFRCDPEVSCVPPPVTPFGT